MSRHRRAIFAPPIVLTALVTTLPFLSRAAFADVFNLPAGQTSLQFVTIGDPGNAADTRVATDGTSGYGSIAYAFQMGKYEVSSSQYAAFLNSVARANDPYGLYSTSMVPNSYHTAAGITRTGSVGSYAYTVASGYENAGVDFVSWGDAARFANWLTNGQPNTGAENASTTENGSYTLNGAITDSTLNIPRNPNALYVIPTENEWYKAAYYKGGSLQAGYFLYPTSSDSAPSNVLNPQGSNNANFHSGPSDGTQTDGTNHITDIGFFVNCPSPYGTFDQAGNMFEWNETPSGYGHRRRGTSISTQLPETRADDRSVVFGSSFEYYDFGFRVAVVPEPSSLIFLALGTGVLLGHARLRRR